MSRNNALSLMFSADFMRSSVPSNTYKKILAPLRESENLNDSLSLPPFIASVKGNAPSSFAGCSCL